MRPTPDIGAGPVRTCIGCRARGVRDDLLRFVADDAGQPVLDPARSALGRGAHLHDDDGCFERALTRRAFARALRVGAVDTDVLRASWAARPVTS